MRIKLLYLFSFLAITNSTEMLIECSHEKETIDIIGIWSMCRTGNDEHQVVSNICRTIIFAEDGTGIIQYPSNEKSKFMWNIKNTTIKFSFKSDKDQNDFFSKKYEFKFKIYEENNIRYFKLITQESDYWYLLSGMIKS